VDSGALLPFLWGTEGRSLHSERVEHPLLDVAVERDPRSLLDDGSQDPPRLVAVEVVLAGSEHDLVRSGVHEPVEVGRAAHGDPGVGPEAPRDQDGRGSQVGESRAVGEEVADGDRRAGKAQLERHVGRDRVVQLQLRLLGQLQDGHGHEALRHAPDPEQGVGGRRQVLLRVARTEPRGADGSAVLHDRDAEAGEPCFPHHLGNVRVEPRPHPGGVRRSLPPRPGGAGQESNREENDQP
jgi:hypothetical protein